MPKGSPGVMRRYTLEDTELALHTLALTGTRFEQAVDLLREQGHDIPKATLWFWARRLHADRYEEIRTEVSNEVAQRVANQAEEIALAAGALELDLLADLKEKRESLDAKDLASALRNVTTTKSLNIDKVASPIRGRPTTVVEHRDAAQILSELARLAPGLVIEDTVDGTVEELQP